MKKISIYLVTLFTVPFLVSCGPAFFKKIINENPEIITESIKNNPGKYMEALSEAQRKYVLERRQQEEQKALAEREKEFENPKVPEISKSRVLFGEKDAPITIVEYSDFQCGYCARASKTLKKILEDYPKQVRILYKHLPLPSHPLALPAAKYYEAIGRQDGDKAKQFHDKIFENQGQLRSGGEKYLKQLARELQINMTDLQRDLKQAEEVVKSDEAEARKFGFNGTPGFLVGGVSVSGARSYGHFKEIIDRHIADIAQKKEGTPKEESAEETN